MAQYSIIFIHGYTASSRADWYPNISKELKKLNIDFLIPDLPGENHPHADQWLQEMHNVLSRITNPIVLVGHSLGTRAILLYLEKYKPKIDTVILIAAFANRTSNSRRNEYYSDFFEHPINIDEIKPLVKKFIVMHSTDDSSIDYEQGVSIAAELNAELITYENRDHFSEPENASYVLQLLKKIL